LTIENVAVVRPMPRARVRMVVRVNVGRRKRARQACVSEDIAGLTGKPGAGLARDQ
jgi:hypothetical protein